MTRTLEPLLLPPITTDDPAPTQRTWRPQSERVALALLVAAIVFQPILRPSGPGNSSPVDLLTVAAIIAAVRWASITHRKLYTPYAVPVALFIIAGAASGLAGPLPSTALIDLVVEILLFFWCTAAVNVLGSARALRVALLAWSWSGMGWAVVVAVAHFAHLTGLEGLTAADGNRVLFTFGDPNYAAAYWCTTLFVAYAAKTPSRRWLRYAGYGALVWALVLTESNGGALELLAGMAFLVVVRAHRRRGWVGVVTVVLVLGLAVGAEATWLPLSRIRTLAATSGQPLLVNSLGRSAQSSSQRGQLISESLQIYERSPEIVGFGPATTKTLLTRWQYPYAKEVHDDYLAALVERGPIGALGILLLVGSVAVRAGPLARRRLPAAYLVAVPRPAGLVAALVSLGLAASYYEILHFRFVWLLFAIVAALARQARST